MVYSFKLKRLLHQRIDPTVEILRKKPLTLKRKRVNEDREDESIPPIGAPNWCLNIDALKKYGRSTGNIPNYDPEEDDDIENRYSDHRNDESDNNDNTAESSKRNRRKSKHNKQKKKKNDQKS